ncbi:hypothetical protein DV737_g2396, partial [Chaetothyriales sp. CBS 132003]
MGYEQRETASTTVTTILFKLAVAGGAVSFAGSQIPPLLTLTLGEIIAADLNASDLYIWMITTGILTVGALAPFVGPLADLVGRKPVLLIGFFLSILGCIVSYAAPSGGVYILGQVFLGAGTVIQELTSISLVTEIVPTAKRPMFAAIVLTAIIPWTPGTMYANWIAESNWRYIGLCLGLWDFIALVLIAGWYHPPPRVNSIGLSKRQILARIDFIGGGIAILSVLLLLVGINITCLTVALRAIAQTVALSIFYNQLTDQVTKNTIKYAAIDIVQAGITDFTAITDFVTALTSTNFDEMAAGVPKLVQDPAAAEVLKQAMIKVFSLSFQHIWKITIGFGALSCVASALMGDTLSMAAAVAMSVSRSRSYAPTRRNGSAPAAVDTVDTVDPTDKDATERRLEQVLFGDDAGFLDALRPQTNNVQALVRQPDGDLPVAVRNQLSADTAAHTLTSDTAPREAVWHDSDDDRVAVSLALNPRLRKLRDTADDDIVSGREYPLAALLRSGGGLTRQSGPPGGLKRRRLQPEVIDIARLPAVTSSGPSSVESLHFHPYYPILLASGPSATASLYHVSPHPPNANPLLTSLHVKKTALRHSEFCVPPLLSSSPAASPPDAASDGTRIILSSRRRYFHIWSLATGQVSRVSRALSTISQQQKTTERFKVSPSGKYIGLVSSTRAGGGTINVLDATTLSWICSCRVDSQGAEGLTVIGKSGQVSEYSLADRRTVARWHDEGAVGSTVLATSRDGRWTAIGSSAGIVNIYDRHAADFKRAVLAQAADDAIAAARPHPTRTLDQLTTPISHLVFSPDSQLLVVASRWKKSALRLVHLPSCTVFRNWPTDSTSLGRISSVAVGGAGTGGAGQ